MSFNLYASLEYLLWEEFYLWPSRAEMQSTLPGMLGISTVHCSPKHPNCRASLVGGAAEHSPSSLAGPRSCIAELGGFEGSGNPP